MAWLKKRGRFWYVACSMNGKEVLRSTKKTDKKDAQKVLRKVEEKLKYQAKSHFNRVSCWDLYREYVAYSEANKRYLTNKHDLPRLRHFFEFIAGLKGIKLDWESFPTLNLYADDVKTLDIEKFKQYLMGSKSNVTAQRYLQNVKALFNFAVRCKLIPENPANGVKNLHIELDTPKYLTEDEIRLILEEAKKDIEFVGRGGKGKGRTRRRETPLYQMIMLAYYAGMRIGEIISLEWEEIDFNKGHIRVPPKKSKNKKGDVIPLHNLLKSMLSEYQIITGRFSGFVFLNKNGRQYDRCNLTRELKRIADKLDLNFSWHIFRHSLASHLLHKGIPLPAVSKILRHRSVELTMKYYGAFSPSHLFDYVNTLASYNTSPIQNQIRTFNEWRNE